MVSAATACFAKPTGSVAIWAVIADGALVLSTVGVAVVTVGDVTAGAAVAEVTGAWVGAGVLAAGAAAAVEAVDSAVGETGDDVVDALVVRADNSSGARRCAVGAEAQPETKAIATKSLCSFRMRPRG